MGSGPTEASRAASRRGPLTTAATALAVVALVVGAGWTLQRAALRTPEHGDVVATQAMSWLVETRPVESTFTLDGRTERTSCTRRTLRLADGNHEPAALLRAGGRQRLIVAGYPYRTPGGARAPKPTGAALTRLQLAGCPPVLESLIGSVVRYTSQPTRLGHARVAGRDALTLAVWTKAGRITVYLAADDKRPLALRVSGPHLSGKASFRWPTA